MILRKLESFKKTAVRYVTGAVALIEAYETWARAGRWGRQQVLDRLIFNGQRPTPPGAARGRHPLDNDR